MTATLFKQSNGIWYLHWTVNGVPYYSAAKTRKDAVEYAETMGFVITNQ